MAVVIFLFEGFCPDTFLGTAAAMDQYLYKNTLDYVIESYAYGNLPRASKFIRDSKLLIFTGFSKART